MSGRDIPIRDPATRRLPSLLMAALVPLALGACQRAAVDTSPGVSLALARHRAATLSAVRYAVDVTIPPDRNSPVTGTVTVRFHLADRGHPVVLDFTGPPDRLTGMTAGGAPVALQVRGGHVVVPANRLVEGENEISLAFVAGDGALNRQEEFLYSLFVPDRASSAFPCFDQPDLKARFRLTLTVPATWTAVTNTALVGIDSAEATATYRYAETLPISTYLFAFAAGRFQVEEAVRNGRVMRLFHRESDRQALERNRDAIFDLHAAALSWLEAYTALPYPFEKFDFVAVPSFQYRGMEHPGAILYRASTLLLDESATQVQQLDRASVIAHETAHMWFGDLVTMRWFDDVWMKEVFANFMAAKIVNPSFPALDHDLRFFLAHHPDAYGVDRTAGANPIRQELENLDEAGSLYGAIIYEKAPIVMRQLERVMGEDAMRDGLRRHLSDAAYGNASWPDLITILDRLTDEDLVAWSRVWVEESGRPTVEVTLSVGADGTVSGMEVVQADPAVRGRTWNQALEVAVGTAGTVRRIPVWLRSAVTEVPEAIGLAHIDFVLPGADGLGYAHVRLDGRSREYLMAHMARIADPIVRSVAWMALWEGVLYGDLSPGSFLDAAVAALATEPDEQVAQQLLEFIRPAYWRFVTAEERVRRAPVVEQALWAGIGRSTTMSLKAAYFNAFTSMALTSPAVGRLERIWAQREAIPGLPLGERQYVALAEALAVRGVPAATAILEQQLARIADPDRRARFAFVMPALSSDVGVRDSVFASFRGLESREREAWVLEAMACLNHPLRSAQAEHYVRPGLELVAEIQRTGDIFFPLRWLHTLLDGHASDAVARTVRQFLDERPEYPPRLRGKILQAADDLFRAAEIIGPVR
ncbi:MAG: M1 family aminopeptidase [Gemmatimonadota bacterium]|nr:M1 family aminopeptidase [Gemmatimonadota bacterium]MDH3367003.1 M1 family aminopeptidase [Gemmatimonadota bacterium]MDH3476749.1 M1 family aminopeptidase [Gemmatimonadota bacterium]